MPITDMGLRSPGDAKARRRRTAGALRRTAAAVGVVGLTAGAGLLTAGSALASNGSHPGDLILKPASGPSSRTPTWSTTDGCPAGYQGSAEMSEFNANGTFGSRISVVVNSPVSAFSGVLDGNVSSLLSLGSTVRPGQTSEWAIGCYSQVAGTGRVKWVQFIFVTLSADGKSYSSSYGDGRPPSTSGNGTSGLTDTSSAVSPSGASSEIEAGVVAGACGLVVAVAGLAWRRRRSRSRLV